MVAYKIRVYKVIGKNKYRIDAMGTVLIVTPQAVEIETNNQPMPIMVGKTAKLLYNAVATQNKQVLKTLLPVVLETATLLLA